MALPKVDVQLGNGGLGRRNPTGNDCGAIIFGGVAAGSSPLAQLNTSYYLKSTDDAIALGIDADYDTDNTVLVFKHIQDYFEKCPNGSLWIMIVAQATTLTEMVDKTETNSLYRLVNESFDSSSGTPARRGGAILNPESPYAPTTTGGIDADVLTAIPKAKELMDQLDSEHAWLGCIVIEGRKFTGTASNATNLRSLASGGIGCVIAQDKVTADLDTLYNSYGAVGLFLGHRSAAPCNEDTMYVEKYNLQDTALSKWTQNALSSNLLVSSYSLTDLGTLHDKGYIFGRKYRGVAGVHWSGNPSCELESDDYAWLNDREVIAKAARLVYAEVIPKLGQPVTVDSNTGKLDPGFVTYMERLGHTALAGMETAGEISGKDMFVDPAQNVLSTSKIIMRVGVTPTGTNRTIEIPLQFQNPYSS